MYFQHNLTHCTHSTCKLYCAKKGFFYHALSITYKCYMLYIVYTNNLYINAPYMLDHCSEKQEKKVIHQNYHPPPTVTARPATLSISLCFFFLPTSLSTLMYEV